MNPMPVSDVMLVFPGDVENMMPQYDEIPKEFKDWNSRTPWNQLMCDWFYSGIQKPQFYMKDGIDGETAFRHIKAVMGSFQPKHEHKEAAVAYLLSQWCTKIEYESDGEKKVAQ